MFVNGSRVLFISDIAFCRRALDIGSLFVWGSLGVMALGMIGAALWQWVFGIRAASLFSSPAVFQVMMIGGLVFFVASLVVTLFVIPAWYSMKSFFRKSL